MKMAAFHFHACLASWLAWETDPRRDPKENTTGTTCTEDLDAQQL